MNIREEQVNNFLDHFNSNIASLALKLRVYIKEFTKPSFELVGDSTISLNIGYGFTEKAWDCYCAIIVYSKHINISFPSGAYLSDPNSLLQGTGKRIRHIKVIEFDDIKVAEVEELILEARQRAMSLMEDVPSENNKVITIVKPISGIKKRSK